MARVVRQSFFDRPTVEVSRELLGKTLCRRVAPGRILRARICETEAYDGFEDRASHAHRGRTKRNHIMFGPPGRAYIYLCYGIHWLFNVSTRERGYPGAVLIRGVESVNGPGRLTKHFQIDAELNGRKLARTENLWIEDEGVEVTSEFIETTSRVGIGDAGPEWTAKPWRFIWKLP